MGASKSDIAGLFATDEADDLGINGKASDIMIANLTANNLPMCIGTPVDDLDTDAVVIVMFAIDASPSMEPVADELIRAFNEVMIDGLKGASRGSVNTLVVGGLAFSSRIWPLWGGGFKKISELPPLSKAEYDPNKGNATNLYQAQIDAITAASAYATTVYQGTGTMPKVIVVTLTDGADNVRQASVCDVKALVDGLSKELFKFPMAVFETWERVNGRQIAAETGCEVFEFQKQGNESEDDIRRRFRRMVGTMSSSLVAASQHNVGGSQTGFWQK